MKLELDSGNNIFYDQWLDGETDLLILNGGPGLSYEIFESFKEHLRGENIRITVYDPLGYHHSDKPEGFDYSIDYYAEEVEEVRKKLNLHNTVIVGHSFGGAVAMNYLLKYQQKVAAALFVNPYISTEKYGQNADILLDKLPDDVRSEIQDLVAQDNFGEDMMTILISEWYPRFFCRLNPWPDALNRSFAHASYGILQQFVGSGYLNIDGDLRGYDITPKLSSITIPSLAITGEHDIIFEEDVKLVSDQMQNCDYTVIQGASHTPMWENPDTFFKSIRDFISKLDIR